MSRYILVFLMFFGVLTGILLSFGQKGATSPSANPILEKRITELERAIDDLKKQLKAVENVDKLVLLEKHANALTKQAEAVKTVVDVDRKHLANQLKIDISEWLKGWGTFLLATFSILLAIGIPTLIVYMLKWELTKRIDDFQKAVNQVKEIEAIKKDVNRSILFSELRPEEKTGFVSAESALGFYGSNEPKGVRETAFEVLMAHGNHHSHIPLLVEALRDKSNRIAHLATDVLKKTGSVAVPHLLRALKDERAKVVCSILEVIKDPLQDIVPALVETCNENSREYTVRLKAINALANICKGRTGEPVRIAVSALKKLLKDDGSVGVRRCANQALGRISDPSSYPALVEALGDLEGDSRTIPINVLKNIGADAIPALKNGEKSNNETIRRRSTQVLQKIDADMRPESEATTTND